MTIKNMFEKDVNRPINGVVKVDQDEAAIIRTEVDEYIITKELKKHFDVFFDAYNEAYDVPTGDVGVWISGFFGSGKSHFMKMLSYILENRSIEGKSVVESFQEKLDDPMILARAAVNKTETILFNIDTEGPSLKDKTAVMRVFAKVFYKHLGFSGSNMKITELEKYVDSMGKTAEFRAVFAEKCGAPWEKKRDAYAFIKPAIVATLEEVLGLSHEDATDWISDKTEPEFSIKDLVEDIETYVNKQPKGYRLVFMVDEVGQYIGADTNMLLNLQSIVEEVGSRLYGKVWVICTGQEGIDAIIKTCADEFSRIQARFKIRLSLTSNSVDEVIQMRLLAKTPEATERLTQTYALVDNSMDNVFDFNGAASDIRGYRSEEEFVKNFPFVPYQYAIMRDAFNGIRQHGNSGKNLSSGERSMLTGFQESAWQIEEKDEYTIAPLYLFYDSLQTSLDSTIRQVIYRCEEAAERGEGIERQDVNVLKLLYLIRYVKSETLPSNLENITVLCADNIQMDKGEERKKIEQSLSRLVDENYVGVTYATSGAIYNFLTDEEQDIARDIRNISVEDAQIQEKIGEIIYNGIYKNRRYRYNENNDFSLNECIDDRKVHPASSGIEVNIITEVTDVIEKEEITVAVNSGEKVVIVLADTGYYGKLSKALQITTYANRELNGAISTSRREIIERHQKEGKRYEKEAAAALETAIKDAKFYVDGNRAIVHGGSATQKMEDAFAQFVTIAYEKIGLIDTPAESDEDIRAVLQKRDKVLPEMEEPNSAACADMIEYLKAEADRHSTLSVFDIQKRYTERPYGWCEIDIALVMAQIFSKGQINIKMEGRQVSPEDKNVVDLLRKKKETAHTEVSIRRAIPAETLRGVIAFFPQYDKNIMDVPREEDELAQFIMDKFGDKQNYYTRLFENYKRKEYPEKATIQSAINLINNLLANKKDNEALFNYLLAHEEAFLKMRNEMQGIENFFERQVKLFDNACEIVDKLDYDKLFLEQDAPVAKEALDEMREIITFSADKVYNYTRIPRLNRLIRDVNEGHDRLLEEKRAELNATADECAAIIGTDKARAYYDDVKENTIKHMTLLVQSSNIRDNMIRYKDNALAALEPVPEEKATNPTPKKKEKSISRTVSFPAKCISDEADIEVYLDEIRRVLEKGLSDADGGALWVK